jgi:hypothetical protein
MMNTVYQITKEQEDIVIRFPSQSIDEAELTRLLDYLTLESIRRRSQISEEQAAYLVQDIKEGAWQQVKHLFME